MPGDLLTTRAAAERLLHDPRLRGACTTCTLPLLRVGTQWCVRSDDLEMWIAAYAAAHATRAVRAH